MKYATIRLWLFTVTILLIPHWLYAATDTDVIAPPQIPNIDHLRPTLTLSPISNILLGNMEIELERTTIGDIQKHANAGVIYHKGDAGGSENWVCYTIPNAKQSERIWFSSGELGGPEHTVGSLYAIIGDDEMKPSASCPQLPAQLRPVSLSNSLWLGTNPNRLKELFGKPSATINDWRFYSYSGKAPINDFEKLAILGVRVRNGKIIGLCEFQATTD